MKKKPLLFALGLVLSVPSVFSQLNIQSKNQAVKQLNVVVDDSMKQVYLPVKWGTNLKGFDPRLETGDGAIVTPKGKQDFTKGAVNYTIEKAGTKTQYAVTAAINNNPVLDGLYADPEILYSEKTKQYYIYPTSDGFTNWSGYYFKVFSSKDLVNWKDKGVILDLRKDVSWADHNAWAPCIVEKKINGKYKYFYYFTAQQKIGVAVADHPEGPFVDTGKPLLTTRPVNRGQVIDPDVFTDPTTNKSYLYWGNGFLACAELNDDMISIKEETMCLNTPPRTFREGAYVIYRQGVYYFMWSQNDTRDENYCVRYATSKSPMGPLEIPKDNLILSKRSEKGIYGTGHHSVLQIPGKDEWYIVYHRFTRPKGIKIGREAGYNRETCIDRMNFNADGTIQPVEPTLEGIKPIKK